MSSSLTECKDCPIAGTQYCHRENPNAKRYARFEKELIRYHIDHGKLEELEDT